MSEDKKQGGRKDDMVKVDFSLVSVIWFTGVMRVMSFGKRKYSAHNWRQGLLIARLVGAAMRHLLLFLAGEDVDYDEDCEGCKSGTCLKHSNECHLDAASCNLMFAREMMVTRPDLDDRHKYDSKVLKILSKMFEM